MLAKPELKYILAAFSIALLVLVVSFSFSKAETSGTSGESGVTSYLKTTYNSVVALAYGSDSAGAWGDWGAYWNRIRSAAEWVPSSAAIATDVRTGKTFYNSSRIQQTGTYPAVSNCSTQEWHDSHASATKETNCGTDWISADPAVEGDDKQDPRTGLVWSQYLRNNAGTVVFGGAASTWSWDATYASNIAVGNKTAAELCSERGNGWRFPTLKEYLQAFVDGIYFDATMIGNNHWTATMASPTAASYITPTSTRVGSGAFGTGYVVRCVR